MGRHLQRRNSGVEYEGNHPGCMWGILHILDNHQWYNVKKMFPHRKHGERCARCIGSPKTLSRERDIEEAHGLMHSESDRELDEQHKTTTSPTNKRCGNDGSKTPITKDNTMEVNHKSWVLSFPAESDLMPTGSCKHSEPSSNFFADIRGNWENRIILLHDTSYVNGDNQQVDDMKIHRKISHHQLTEYADVMEILEVNKDLMQKIKQDSDAGIAKERLTKSDSFPLAGYSRARFDRTPTMKHKQHEVWSIRKAEIFPNGIQESKYVASKRLKDYHTKVMPSEGDDSLGTLKQKMTFASLGLTTRFKHIKQRIKHALKDRKKESDCKSIDAVLQEVPSDSVGRISIDGENMSVEVEGTMNNDVTNYFTHGCETATSDYDFTKNNTLKYTSTTSTLNELADTYALLFDHCFSRDTKQYKSKSIKLRNEDTSPSTGCQRRSFRRNLSLPDLDMICSLLSEVSCDTLCSGMPLRTVVDHNSKQASSFQYKASKSEMAFPHTELRETLESDVGNGIQNSIFGRSENIASTEYLPALTVSRTDKEIVKQDELCTEPTERKMEESSLNQEHEIDSCLDILKPISFSAVNTCSADKLTIIPQYTTSEGVCSNDGIANKSYVLPFLRPDFDENDDSDFNYVKTILMLSGLIGDGGFRIWHDNPLMPSLFNEMECLFPPKSECCEEEFGSYCHHWILFDLVNESLQIIFEKSFTYFPRTLSSLYSIHPKPIEEHLLKEVWTTVSWYLNLKPELDQSVDYEVALDFEKGNRWINLQPETECIALEVEELIFDELLSEILCSLDC